MNLPTRNQLAMLAFAVVFVSACCAASLYAQDSKPTPLSKKDKRIRDLLQTVTEVGENAQLDYALAKKKALLKKYPTLEREYLSFVRTEYPTLEGEIIAVFKKYPEALSKFAKYDDNNKLVLGFDLLEKVCLEDQDCADEIGDLLSETHPTFVKKTAQYVLDNKPELLVDLAIVTFEVLLAKQKELESSSDVTNVTADKQMGVVENGSK